MSGSPGRKTFYLWILSLWARPVHDWHLWTGGGKGGQGRGSKQARRHRGLHSPNSNSSVSRVQQLPGYGWMTPEANVSEWQSHHQHILSFWSVTVAFWWLRLKTGGTATEQRFGNCPLIAFNNPNRLCHLCVFLIHTLLSSQQITARNKLWYIVLPLILKEVS